MSAAPTRSFTTTRVIQRWLEEQRRWDLTSCASHHAWRGYVVCCELGSGHEGCHAAEVGQTEQVVRWSDNVARSTAHVRAAIWRYERQADWRVRLA